MKKTLVLLTVCLMVFSLQGCKSSDHGLDPDHPVKITMWHYYASSQKNAFDKLVNEFNATEGKEKGILVEAIAQGGVSDLEAALIDSADGKVGSGEFPDLFSAYASSAKTIDEKHGLATIDEYLSKAELDEYIDAYIEEGDINHDGKHKLFPTAKATEILMLNKTEWDRFANDTNATTEDLSTWEGLAKTAEAYYTWSNGKAFFGRDAMANYILSGAMQLEHRLFQHEENGVTFHPDETAMRQIYDNYYIPYIKGYYLKNGKYASDDIKTKDTIAQVGSSSSSAFFPSVISVNDHEEEQIDYLVLPIPNFAGKDPVAVQQGASIAISKGEETKEYASIVFLRWLSEAQRNLVYAGETGYLPVKKKVDLSILDQIDSIKAVVKDTIAVSQKQIESSTLYTFEAFDHSSEVRNYIENTLTTLAKENRTALEQRVAKGEEEETVLEEYLSDEVFQSWYQNFVKDITKLLEGNQA